MAEGVGRPLADARGSVWSRLEMIALNGHPCYRASASAVAAQLVADAEIHWSCPCGNSLSKNGWIGIARLFTYHDQSSSCVSSKNLVPRL